MSTYFQLDTKLQGRCKESCKLQNNTHLRKQAEALITEGRMPSLDAVLTAVAEARENFLPLILAARNDGNRFCDSAERKEDYERT